MSVRKENFLKLHPGQKDRRPVRVTRLALKKHIRSRVLNFKDIALSWKKTVKKIRAKVEIHLFICCNKLECFEHWRTFAA